MPDSCQSQMSIKAVPILISGFWNPKDKTFTRYGMRLIQDQAPQTLDGRRGMGTRGGAELGKSVTEGTKGWGVGEKGEIFPTSVNRFYWLSRGPKSLLE